MLLLDLGLTLAGTMLLMKIFFSSCGEEMLPFFFCLDCIFLLSIRKSFPTFPVLTDYQHPALWRKELQISTF